MNKPSTPSYDVIIIGGSYAGLSAALVLGRSLWTVLVLDSGQPANRQTPYSHSFLTRDGETPAELTRIARQQALAYPTVSLRDTTVTTAQPLDSSFQVRTNEGEVFTAKRLILATGLTDILPDLPGFAECWGISVLHCPFCHGYEVKDQVVGVLGNGDDGFGLTKLIHHWNPGLTLFTNGPSTLTPEQTAKLYQHAIPIVETPLVALQHQDGHLIALELADQSTQPLQALYARPAMQQSNDLARQLGCEMDEMGFIKVDEFGKTSVMGVFAAGDNHTMMRQVLVAATNGQRAAVMITRELMEEEF
ncbi:NAD(P)/FAD-dependent oxidoreductase [Larkinella punicea]|uniref:NAD(P)/FAD-dependent oxidoreductase n=1 Tax=Larkinella punicea TaxID=2315727 RepID=A0A368JHH2_9BACT|nr:NAD(P)/FAD-dependent oxidoreductase [Larkinella punicea]RCR66715.1 NAD(P)/FAD-dependent oxidoreductase [Larkinella punicea]